MPNLSATLRGNSIGILLSFLPLFTFAQSIDMSADLSLIDSLSQNQLPHSGNRPYIFKGQPKTWKNSNPVSILFGSSLYVYQNVLSQHFSADCLYDPTCSDFSKQVVKEFGLIKGGLLSFDRLSRCNRIAATGLDPGLIDKNSHRFDDPIKRYK